jgi:hypothetical protein
MIESHDRKQNKPGNCRGGEWKSLHSINSAMSNNDEFRLMEKPLKKYIHTLKMKTKQNGVNID